MIDPFTIVTAAATSPLISFTWEAIKSGVVYDIIKNASGKTLTRLLDHKEQNNLNGFSEVLETAIEMNPKLKAELEEHMNNSITITGNSNQAIHHQEVVHHGNGDIVVGDKYTTIQAKEDIPKY